MDIQQEITKAKKWVEIIEYQRNELSFYEDELKRLLSLAEMAQERTK